MFGLLLASCVDPGTTDSDTASPTVDDSIVDRLEEDGRFAILIAALNQTDLATTLRQAGAWTLFAPTDTAFEKAGITAKALKKQASEVTRADLGYHLLPSTVSRVRLPDRPQPTLDGLTLFVTNDIDLRLNTSVGFVGDPIIAENGLVHVIDDVLTRPDVLGVMTLAGLSEFPNGLVDSGLDTLLDEGGHTLFALTDAAYTPPPGDATSFLRYHLVEGDVPWDAPPRVVHSLATELATLPNRQTGHVTQSILVDRGGATLNGGVATMVRPDLVGTNGRVHVLDHAIEPFTIMDALAMRDLTFTQLAIGRSDPLPGDIVGPHDPIAMAAALRTTELGPAILFAPTNDAWDAQGGSFDALTAPELLAVMSRHIVLEVMPRPLADLPDQRFPVNGAFQLALDTTTEPPQITVRYGQTVDIETLDIGATNGMVHEIGGLLVHNP